MQHLRADPGALAVSRADACGSRVADSPASSLAVFGGGILRGLTTRNATPWRGRRWQPGLVGFTNSVDCRKRRDEGGSLCQTSYARTATAGQQREVLFGDTRRALADLSCTYRCHHAPVVVPSIRLGRATRDLHYNRAGAARSACTADGRMSACRRYGLAMIARRKMPDNGHGSDAAAKRTEKQRNLPPPRASAVSAE